ncbi:hypothetical protein PIB30_025885 [Stylosanthes scabra]|uniref:Uncharacterized protein n=1 Tax=Stylosanthes scabra TaxID=79078 RepID=A0ABU6Y962_9FABA|nr:hypothetical protein [Stylosanthes scabra]
MLRILSPQSGKCTGSSSTTNEWVSFPRRKVDQAIFPIANPDRSSTSTGLPSVVLPRGPLTRPRSRLPHNPTVSRGPVQSVTKFDLLPPMFEKESILEHPSRLSQLRKSRSLKFKGIESTHHALRIDSREKSQVCKTRVESIRVRGESIQEIVQSFLFENESIPWRTESTRWVKISIIRKSNSNRKLPQRPQQASNFRGYTDPKPASALMYALTTTPNGKVSSATLKNTGSGWNYEHSEGIQSCSETTEQGITGNEIETTVLLPAAVVLHGGATGSHDTVVMRLILASPFNFHRMQSLKVAVMYTAATGKAPAALSLSLSLSSRARQYQLTRETMLLTMVTEMEPPAAELDGKSSPTQFLFLLEPAAAVVVMNDDGKVATWWWRRR